MAPLKRPRLDEDLEQDPDRWCSHSAAGQELWQVISQWVWNLRLELGHVLDPEALRTTEFAPACLPAQEAESFSSSSSVGYGPAEQALPWKRSRFSGRDFAPQPDGTLRCPAGQSLVAHKRRREADGSLRVVDAASIGSCRPCPLRELCQWQGTATKKPSLRQCVAAPSRRRRLSPPLEGLEPQTASAGVHAAPTPPTGGRDPSAGPPASSSPIAAPALSCAARPLPPLVAGAVGAQCPCPNRWPDHDPALRRA